MTVLLTSEEKVKILAAEMMYKIMQQVLEREKLIDREKEHCWVACLAANYRLLGIELISFGNEYATKVEPIDVFSFAVEKKAKKVVLIHNHPSGALTPSVADTVVTEKMIAAGKFLGIRFVEHLIIAEEGYHSYAEAGHLEVLRRNSKIDLTFRETDRLKQMLREKDTLLAMREKALKKSNEEKEVLKEQLISSVKQMLADKMTLAQIVKYSGLSEAEVKKIKAGK